MGGRLSCLLVLFVCLLFFFFLHDSQQSILSVPLWYVSGIYFLFIYFFRTVMSKRWKSEKAPSLHSHLDTPSVDLHRKPKTRDLATKAKVLRYHRQALRRGGGVNILTSNGGGNIRGVGTKITKGLVKPKTKCWSSNTTSGLFKSSKVIIRLLRFNKAQAHLPVLPEEDFLHFVAPTQMKKCSSPPTWQATYDLTFVVKLKFFLNTYFFWVRSLILRSLMLSFTVRRVAFWASQNWSAWLKSSAGPCVWSGPITVTSFPAIIFEVRHN